VGVKKMENVNARRGFLKGFGLLGAAAGGFVAAQNSFANTPPPTPIGSPTVHERDNGPVEDIAHLAPLGLVNVHFQADNRPPPPPPPVNHYGYMISSGTHNSGTIIGLGNMASTEGHNNVKMSVGKDNRLWIEVDGQWRRVALEG
jgi:hypothetical protein